MRAPLHSWCRSGVPLAIVLLILMSSGEAQAAGRDGDEGFFQAVIEGRKNSREAYERAKERDRVDAVEESRRREREASARRTDPAAVPGAARLTSGLPHGARTAAQCSISL